MHCKTISKTKSSAEAEHFVFRRSRNYLLENWGARRAAFRLYYFDQKNKKP